MNLITIQQDKAFQNIPISNAMICDCRSNPDKQNWYILTYCYSLPEEFIREIIRYEYFYNCYWINISKRQRLTEQFIEEYAHKLNWNDLSAYQILSEPFIEKYANKVNWYYISYVHNFSHSFLHKHANRIQWDYFLLNESITPHLVNKYKHKIKLVQLWSLEEYNLFMTAYETQEEVKQHHERKIGKEVLSDHLPTECIEYIITFL